MARPLQLRSGRTLFSLLLTTAALFLLSGDLLASIGLLHSHHHSPISSAGAAPAHFVDCRRVVFHPYCRGISARRSASYTAEQMKGLNPQAEAEEAHRILAPYDLDYFPYYKRMLH